MWLGASMADDAQRRDLSKKVGYGSATPPGDATSPTRQTPPGLGPNSPSRRELLADSWQPSPGLATTWGPYFQALFPPGRVTAWDNFKRMSTGVNIARRLWDQREEMLQEYEALHGTHHAQWPTQHPGVVLDAVQWVAHPACLACHWFHHGVSMRDADWQIHAAELALRHQSSHGAYIDDGRPRLLLASTPERNHHCYTKEMVAAVPALRSARRPLETRRPRRRVHAERRWCVKAAWRLWAWRLCSVAGRFA
jgi:hypothetical protein